MQRTAQYCALASVAALQTDQITSEDPVYSLVPQFPKSWHAKVSESIVHLTCFGGPYPV